MITNLADLAQMPRPTAEQAAANLAAFLAKESEQMASIQFLPAEPVAFYTRTSARCRCESTIMLRTDGYWTHGARQGLYCREGSR